MNGKRYTVRKLKGSGKRYYFGVGTLVDGKWTLLRQADPDIQLLYPNRLRAQKTASWLTANKA